MEPIHTAAERRKPGFRFFDLPRELRDHIYDLLTPDLEVKSCKSLQRVGVSPYHESQYSAELENQSDWQTLVHFLSTNKKLRGELLEAVYRAVSLKKLLTHINLVDHEQYGEESAPGSRPLQSLLEPEELFKKTLFDGMTPNIKIRLPLILVDLSAHAGSLAGRLLRAFIEDTCCRNRDPELVSTVDITFEQELDGSTLQWSASFDWKEVAIIELVQSRDIVGDWVLVGGASNIKDMQSQMQSKLEDLVHDSVAQLLPGDTALSWKRLYRMQRKVCGLADQLSSVSRDWTTRSMVERMDAFRANAHRGVKLGGSTDHLQAQSDEQVAKADTPQGSNGRTSR